MDLTLEELEPGIALLTLRRPERLNALTWDLIDDLHATLAAVAGDDRVRVVILTGAASAAASTSPTTPSWGRRAPSSPDLRGRSASARSRRLCATSRNP
jgi:hypothetical protein